jgi:two-component system NarL family sensor kinase
MGLSRRLAKLPYGVLILRDGQPEYINPAAESVLGPVGAGADGGFWALLEPHDLQRVRVALAEVQDHGLASRVPTVGLRGLAPFRSDLLLAPIRFRKRPAVQMILLDSDPERRAQEVVRELTVALAGASDLNQTLEAALVKLRDLIPYDRAGLYLLDEDRRYLLSEKTRLGPVPSQSPFLHNDPVLNELRRTRLPIAVSDIQKDERFLLWPDTGSLHGWIGAPLIVDGELTGILSLGSLKKGAYGQQDASLLASYLSQVAAVLERASGREAQARRPDELEVLSSFSIALGRAEGQDRILASTLDHILSLSGAGRGAYFQPDITESVLLVHSSTDDSLLGGTHPFRDDPLWQAFEGGQVSFIDDLRDDWKKPGPSLRPLFRGMRSAAVIPLKTEERTFGVFCFTFAGPRRSADEGLQLMSAIADIAAGSLERVLALESLEAKVQTRTRHLSTLYTINTLASEALDLQVILDRVLRITLEAMGNSIAMIHLLEAAPGPLVLVSQFGVPPGWSAYLEALQPDETFWSQALEGGRPLLVPDLQAEPDFPAALRGRAIADAGALVSTAIRTKGQILGLMTHFGPDVVRYTTSELTLFASIADQIGMLVERSRLITRAEQTAVLEERQRLARELHDSVTQLLYSQVLFSGAGLKVLNQGDLPLTEHYLSRIDGAALQALKEMRLLLYELGLRDQMQDGLVPALRRRLEAVEKRAGVEASLESSQNLDLEETLETALFQIAQEALNNSLKHSGASSVEVCVIQENGSIRLSVADNGRGFEVAERLESGGMGLKNMQARALEHGVEFLIRSSPNEGTIVQVSSGMRDRGKP